MTKTSNIDILKKLLIFSVVMFGFGYALVPIYKKFCEVTGIYELERPDTVSKKIKVDITREINLQLDANIRGLPWKFKPLQSHIRLHPGKLTEVMYEISNESEEPQIGQAIPSYSPKNLERYLKKVECFCFSQQELGGKETKQLPVRFLIDPEMPDDIHTATISYTFFKVKAN
ncbi:MULTISPECIES: cytochrome c oxidase assembly protein [Nitrosomonas]|uniref:Cytochrome c oxidase assembly protein CtaG n=2 Tax=Nitrosomonas eutropha TaxID=916 RepID=A0ABX5M8D7_9PROT|nr:cytochrome c oxidase assembly protein [Nitrosomonas eutropha]ABI60607.1 cytochrome c oxidase assembly protein CtaG/Cox11 [Nitrosomonas eutropha C91]PXV77515.1 cytochrome c oxidase assembly protein subunit 11 [Nitrosomonas eutropha]SCX22095.1 cytochrome c oxidase assembly protein subunit 11 [Nitrosomonas eutropha]SDW59701.1 cytochrome c oxidase assembly protein subunit 11 [Nitrosomonas eutropha]SEJ05223.1 cytochrome c oxidase assembly protein subunit 11 [Nitrosomonas eutropha]